PPSVGAREARGPPVAVATGPRRNHPAPARPAVGVDVGARSARRAGPELSRLVAGALLVTTAREGSPGPVRAPLGDVPAGERAGDVVVPRAYRHSGDRSREQLVEHLAERVADYAAELHRVAAALLADAVNAA